MGRGAPHASGAGGEQNTAAVAQIDKAGNSTIKGNQNVVRSQDDAVAGNGASAEDNGGGGTNAGEALTAKLPAGWHVHKLDRGKICVPLAVPFGFEVKGRQTALKVWRWWTPAMAFCKKYYMPIVATQTRSASLCLMLEHAPSLRL